LPKGSTNTTAEGAAFGHLDIVLTKPLVPVLRTLLSNYWNLAPQSSLPVATKIIVTSLSHITKALQGFRESVNDGCKIPPFNDDEVKEAAREFVKIKLGVEATRSAQDFADKIIALSADSQSLQEITRNPLLLALLCELFAKEENVVPEDLTVSQLYAKYWDWKIPKVRGNSPSIQVGLAKERLCLEIAEAMYNKSDERLRDFIYESNLNLLNETESSAYSELKSDGIIKEIGGSGLYFSTRPF
jgi:hypothetical protein